MIAGDDIGSKIEELYNKDRSGIVVFGKTYRYLSDVHRELGFEKSYLWLSNMTRGLSREERGKKIEELYLEMKKNS